MKRTTAPGSLSGQYIDFNSSSGAPGTLLISEDRNLTQEEIISPIEGASIPLSGNENDQLFKAIKKIVVEKSKAVGEIFFHQQLKSPTAWNSISPDAYFPALCLTAIDKYVDISETNWPLLVPYLRSLKIKYNDGINGEIENFGTNFSPTTKDSGGIVTMTLNGNGGSVIINALGEDYNIHSQQLGNYSDFRVIRLNQDIFTGLNLVPAGFYPITLVNPLPLPRISFDSGIPGATGSSDDIYVSFYPHQIFSDTGTARVFSFKGLSITGLNDGNGYFINTLRRRGYFQSHFTVTPEGAFHGSGGTTHATPKWSAGDILRNGYGGLVPRNDGQNGEPRMSKETHSPCFSSQIYIHGGIYV